MPWKFRDRKQKEVPQAARWPRYLALALLVGGLAALPHLWHRYGDWDERRRLSRANEALTQGDFRSALLEARGVLERRSASPLAEEIVRLANDALKAPESMAWTRTGAVIEGGDDDQLLGVAEAFLGAGDFLTAERALDRLRAEMKKTARFHDLSARVAAARQDVPAARAHWQEAARLAPEEARFRVQETALRLLSPDDAERREAEAQMAAIRATPDGSLPALRALLIDARRRSDLARARDLAVQLAATPGAEFRDRLALLEALQPLRPKRDDEFASQLSALQQAAAASPDLVFQMASWMVDNDLALLLPEWAATLPPAWWQLEPNAPVLAQAWVRAADWPRLQAHVESAIWGEQDFMRLAFLALALERQGKTKASDPIWKEALATAQLAPDRLERLGRACDTWGWRDRAEQVLWKLAPSEWCPRWVMDYLVAAAAFRKDTAALYEATRLKLRTDPQNVVLRNNAVNLALLTNAADDATHATALAVHREQPGSAALATTYGLSLLVLGRPHEAVAALEAYPAEQLRQPAVALYFGVFLAAAGQMERALGFLELAALSAKFPEESALARVFGAVAEARLAQQAGDEAGGLARWTYALRGTSGQPAWLDLLSRTALEWDWKPAAEAALLRLAEEDRFLPGAEEPLWAAAVRTGNRQQLYRAARLLARARPKDPVARERHVFLAVAGRWTNESPLTLAEELVRDFPASPTAAASLALAFAQQSKLERAAEVLAALPAASLQVPRVALAQAYVWGATGRAGEAAQRFSAAKLTPEFPEEKALAEILAAAFSTRSGNDFARADVAWNQALELAASRPDWLEWLARFASDGGAPQHQLRALWKLTSSEERPLWAVQALWKAVEKDGTSAERYQAAKLRAKADPADLVARCNWILLGLLTNQELDAPHREAKLVYTSFNTDAGAAIVYALSQFLQEKREDALKTLGALPEAQLSEPRPQLYRGLFFAAKGDSDNAAKCLRAGAKASLFPEERAFAERTVTTEPLKAILRSYAVASR